MKIAVVGCGAVGSYYGARLCQAGHEVHFLLRSDYEVVRRQGVFIHSLTGDFHVRPRSARAPADIGPSDLVLIALKTTANDQLPRLLPPLADHDTAVLTLQNGLGNVEALARLVPPEQILGGLAFVCLNRTAPGVIHHLDHGRIAIGECARPALARTHALADVFRNAGVDCAVTDNLPRSQWEKLVWNIPMNGLGVASAAGFEAVRAGAAPPAGPLAPCRTTDQLLAEECWSGLVRALMLEIIAIANRLGFRLPATLVEHYFAQTRTMGAYKPSTLLDFERGRPLELDSIFFEPLRRARGAGVAAPCLEALCRVLAGLALR